MGPRIVPCGTPLFIGRNPKGLKRVTAPCVLGNKLLNIQFAKYHERNIQPIISQEHRDAIPPMSCAKLTGARGFQIWYLALNIRKL